MPFVRSLLAAVLSHWLISEILLLVANSQWTILLSAAWLLVGYHRIFGRIPDAASGRDAVRAAIMAWLWPLAPKKNNR